MSFRLGTRLGRSWREATIDPFRSGDVMWTSAQITITIEEVYGNTVLVRIALPVGVLEVIGEADFRGRELRVTNAHIQGLAPGALGRAGLNSLGRKILETYDVDVVHVAGASRTTGRNPDRPPRPFRYPRRC